MIPHLSDRPPPASGEEAGGGWCGVSTELMTDGRNRIDQIIEIAQYLDARIGDKETLTNEVSELVQQEKREEALEKIIAASGALSTSPERGCSPPACSISYQMLT